jgi:hypothetical protein
MVCPMQRSKRIRSLVCVLAAAVLLVVVAACSSPQPKPMAQPTPDQVRGHADRGFDKLKQEEQERPSHAPR